MFEIIDADPDIMRASARAMPPMLVVGSPQIISPITVMSGGRLPDIQRAACAAELDIIRMKIENILHRP